MDTPPGKLTMTQLIEFSIVMGVADQQGNRTHPRWWGITEWEALPNGFTQEEITELVKQKKSPIPFHAERLNICKTNKVCLRMTDLKLEFIPKVSMARLEWKHEWPDRSSCAQEWKRLVREIEAHERQHAKDAEDIVKTLNANMLKRKEFRTTSAETEGAALAEMERLLQQAIKDELDFAHKESGIKEEETHRKYSIKDPDYTQCRSYSFETMKYHGRSEHRSSGRLIFVEEIDHSISGTICGNPEDEKSSGYLMVHAIQYHNDPKGLQQRIRWNPERVRPTKTAFHFYLDLQPPQIEWTIDPGMYHSASVQMGDITITSIPSERVTLRVPLTVSEEPLGCD